MSGSAAHSTSKLLRLPSRRMALWLAVLLLVAGLLATLVWLAGRYEVEQQQMRIEHEVQAAASDIRARLARNIQSLQALRTTAALWISDAQELLRSHRELVRLEWRDSDFKILAQATSPYFADVLQPRQLFATSSARDAGFGDLRLTCERARREAGPIYGASYFFPSQLGQGLELMELCFPLLQGGQAAGYVVAVYGLQALMVESVRSDALRDHEISFTEPDGTRLAVHGLERRGGQLFSARQLLDLPGNTLVLRMDYWRALPQMLPNVLTAVVILMSVALLAALAMLGRDGNRRIKAEKELAQALALRKAMEDSLVTGLRARDMQGRIIYVNPAFCSLTGFDVQELIGQKAPMPYWPPELVDEYQQRQAIRLSSNSPAREGYESVFMRKNGERFPVLVFEAPLIDAKGAQTGWMSAVVDITEQRRMEESTRAAQERLQASARLAMVGEMASLLSHELNQPLSAISSFATGTSNMLLTSPELPREDVLHALSRIAVQAERAGKVIKSVHDFVRRRQSLPQSVKAQSLLDAVLPLVQLYASKQGVQLCIEGFATAPAVLADRTMVEQVLLNLARNGIQAMQSQPASQRQLTLRVRALTSQTTQTEQGAAWLEFAVIDQGQGIDEDTARKIFTPFFSTKPDGMGLGLSMCRTVVEQHGGQLRFEPYPPQGTAFIFTLPVAHSSA